MIGTEQHKIIDHGIDLGKSAMVLAITAHYKNEKPELNTSLPALLDQWDVGITKWMLTVSQDEEPGVY